MPGPDVRALDRAVARLTAHCEAAPHVRAELQRARRQFFGTEAPEAGERRVPNAAEQRFAEWFVLERESEVLGAVPIDVPKFAHDAGLLGGSIVGAFVVEGVDDDGVDARDLQDGEVLELSVPAGSLLAGDLLVGRLFPQSDGRWLPSAAAAVFRPGATIAAALQRDLERVELGRRLFQIEIEHLLLRRTDQAPSPTAAPRSTETEPPLEHLEARLDALLSKANASVGAAAISRQLADADRPGQVMGPLLERLAFDTDVDLDATRRLLLQIWNAYHDGTGAEEPSVENSPGTLGEQLVRTLDEGLRRKQDVDDLFAKLERMAGLEPGASDDGDNPFDREEEDEASSDDDPTAGDLGPLVQEFLWETGRGGDAAAGPLQLLVELQGNAPVPRTDLEAVTAQDLMRLLLHCYLGAPPNGRAAAVRAAFGELQRFYEWAQHEQELDLTHVLRSCRGALLDQVDRLEAAGIALSTATGMSRTPTVLAVEDVRPAGFGVRDDEGGHHWIEVGAAATGLLRVGDLVLGQLGAPPGDARIEGMVVVLPTDARSLME